MRGSPWFRTLIVAVALGLAAWGIACLTAPRPRAMAAPEPSGESAVATTTEAPFFLTLSAEAREVLIEAGGEPRRLHPEGRQAAGTLTLDGPRPTIFLQVRWAEDEDVPRFAKLTLEPAGLPTREQVFDGHGDLDEVWEPDFTR